MPIWGYSSPAPTFRPRHPGPKLVVHGGRRTCTLVLHNQLAAADHALAFPAQPLSAFSGGGTGGPTRRWDRVRRARRLTPSPPAARHLPLRGGPHADGARQVALGLSGALVVLPATGSGPTAAGQSRTTTRPSLVLTELDPALNQPQPGGTSTCARFGPRYRLINGKPFPSHRPVSTGLRRTVLLRYVNAGALQHPMDLLGGTRCLAQDGRPAAHPQAHSLVADLAAGSTVDTLVRHAGRRRVPSSPSSRPAAPEQQRHDRGRPEPGRQRRHDDLPRHRGAPTDRRPGRPRPVTPDPLAGARRTAPSQVSVDADISDATHRRQHRPPPSLWSTTPGSPTAPGLRSPDAGARFGTNVVTIVTGHHSGGPGRRRTATARTGHPRAVSRPASTGCSSAARRGTATGASSPTSLLNLPKVGPLFRNGIGRARTPTNGAQAAWTSPRPVTTPGAGRHDQPEPSGRSTPWRPPGNGAPMSVRTRRHDRRPVDCDTSPDGSPTSLGRRHPPLLVRVHDSLGLWGPEARHPVPPWTRSGPTVSRSTWRRTRPTAKLDDPGNPGNLVASARHRRDNRDGGVWSPAPRGSSTPARRPTAGSGFKLVATDGSYRQSSEGRSTA